MWHSHLILLWFLLGMAPAASAEIYKWVDENGKTHYSQTPPKQSTEPVERVTTDNGAAPAMQPKLDERGYWYCGKRSIVAEDSRPDWVLAVVTKNRPMWVRELANTRERMQKKLDRNRMTGAEWRRERAEYRREVEELECLIRFADTRMNQLARHKGDYVQRLMQVRAAIRELEGEMQQKCGQYAPGGREASAGRLASCTRSDRRRLSRLKSQETTLGYYEDAMQGRAPE